MLNLTKSNRNPFLFTGLGILAEQLSLETVMSTRILSVFNLLKRVGFAVLLLGAVVQAHAQEMIWARNGLRDSSGYGTREFSLGDVNEDGFMDFAVESFSRNWGQDPFGGYLEMFHGGNIPAPTPFRILLPDTSLGLKYGTFYVLGDINGDGITDWCGDMLPRIDFQTEVFQFYFDGLVDSTVDLEWRIRNQSIYPMGDFNGDGIDDLYRYYLEPLDYGEVYYGNAEFDTIPDWTMHSPPGHRYQAWPDDFADLNSDGYQDFVSSNPDPENQLHFFFGSQLPDTIPVAVWTNYRDFSTRIINDLNGDGKDELVGRGLPVRNINVHFGGDVVSQTPDRVLQFLGCAGGTTDIIGVGDVNDDNFNDMVVIDWDCATNDGKLALYLGSFWLNLNPVFEFTGGHMPYDLLGIISGAGLGDVNNDGVGDFAVGAWNDETAGRRGRAVVIAGTRDWIVPVGEQATSFPRDFQVTAFPNPFNSTTTLRMDLPIGTRNVKLSVCNILGQEVEQREIAVLAPRLDIQLSADNWASGIYLARAEAMGVIETTKLVLLK